MFSGQLLQTKLQRPRVTAHLVPRPRLVERLNQGSRGPLTLVCAAAGYGKTTLVSSWIEGLAAEKHAESSPPVAWISLDKNDSELGLFLRYLIASLRTIFPGACADTLQLLQAQQEPPRELLVATLSNEIAQLPRDFVLVLDDHQSISGMAEADLLSDLVPHWPQPMHLVLISRNTPALPMASLRARGQITEIRTRDLRFTPEETAAYLNQALPAPLSQAASELLERDTEGWIAGLQLVTLSLEEAKRPEAILENLSGIGMVFADYLVDEVLAHQPRAVLAFLWQTAALDHFSTTLCESIISTDDPEWHAQRCIDWLERRNLFIISLDGQKEWYRYHHMFRSVLQQRSVAELGPDRVTDVQRKAASWYAQRGFMDEALRYALAANDLELAATLVDQGLCAVLNREDPPTLERWLRMLPEAFVQARPGLLLAKAWSLQKSWQLGAQAKVLRHVGDLLEQGAGATLPADQLQILRGQVAALRGQEAYFSNQHTCAIDYLREALVLLPQKWLYVRSGCMLYLGLSMQASGQGHAAKRLLIEDYESLSDKESTYALRILLALCMVYYNQAEELERVRQTAQKMVEGAECSKLRIMQGWGRYWMGLAHYQRNELADAEQHFAELLAYRYTTQIAALRDGMTRLALIYQIAGKHAEAWEMVASLAALDLDQKGSESDDTAALRARLQLMDGDLEGAVRWSDAFVEPVPDLALPFIDSPHMIKAQILVTQGTPADVQAALEILDALWQIAERSSNTRLKIEVLALRTLALGAQGKADAAKKALQLAVNLARQGGFVRPFVNLGPRMHEALGQLARQAEARGAGPRPAAETLWRILAAFPDHATARLPGADQGITKRPAALAVPTLVESLTPREVEILTLMAEPISLKEIARDLFITYGTAKRHTLNIYGKLGVNKRREAVARAAALGILRPR